MMPVLHPFCVCLLHSKCSVRYDSRYSFFLSQIVGILIKNNEFDKAEEVLNKHFPKPMVGKVSSETLCSLHYFGDSNHSSFLVTAQMLIDHIVSAVRVEMSCIES